MEFRQLYKGNKTLMYKLQFKPRIVNMNAKVDKDNNIIVSAPIGTDQKIIDAFVLKYFDKLLEYIDKKEENSLINWKENIIYIKGVKYNIVVQQTNSRQKYEIIGNKVYLFLKDESNKEKLIIKLLDEQGKDYIIKKANLLAKKLKFDVSGGFGTKWYTTKWGQCDVKERKITFAIQLITFNDEIIEYVIIHELCHLKHPNHSKEFWDLVASFYPKYKWAREKLKFQV